MKKSKLPHQTIKHRIHRIPTHILDQLSDGFIIFDRSLKYKYINKAAAELVDRRVEDLFGQSLWASMPDAKKTEAGQKFWEAINSGKMSSYQIFFTLVQKWFDVRIYPGEEEIIVNYRDITHEKLLEQQKDDFIAMATHEIKTPLSSTKMLAQFLLKQADKGAQDPKLIRLLNAQVNKLTDIVNDLLDVRRLEQGNLELKNEVFILKPLAVDIVKELQLTAQHKLIVNWRTKLLIYADKARVHQVLTNFITNAIKFSPPQKNIIIASQKVDKSLVVSVQDFGIGIPKAEQAYVFDRFYQVADNTNKTAGMGLGLYIAKELITRMGGKIWLESEEGKGSTFYFSLPIYVEKN